MTDRELMQQALEALELLARYENPATKIQVRKPRDGGSIVTMYPHKVASEAATALRAAIEQAQEPVALEAVYEIIIHWDEGGGKRSRRELARRIAALYTTPRQWQGLTNEEIENMMDYWSEPARSAYGGAHTANGEYVCIADIIRDAEKRLKEKNHG